MMMGLWTALAIGVVAWTASRSVAAWRHSRSFRLRRPSYEVFTADGYFTQLVDFVEMDVMEQATSPVPTPGVASWPALHELRRLDGPRWEARPHPIYAEHRLVELRARATRSDPGSRLLQSERSELEQLASGNLTWEEWAWASRVEPAYQLFVKQYRPAGRVEAQREARSLESIYLGLWQSEAERLAASGHGPDQV